MTTQQLITLLEYLLYCLRAYNISGYEREQAIKEAREAIKALKAGTEAAPLSNRYVYYFQSLDRNELLNTMNEVKSTIDGDVIVHEQIQKQGAVFFGRIECLKDSNKPTL